MGRRVSRTALNALKAELAGKKGSELTMTRRSKIKGDISMRPSVRKMKIAFFGRNKKVPYVLESMKLADRKITFMSTGDIALAEIRNKENKLVGIIKAEREGNKLSTIGDIPSPLMKDFNDLGLEKREKYYRNELNSDRIRIIKNINFDLPKGKGFTEKQVIELLGFKKKSQ